MFYLKIQIVKKGGELKLGLKGRKIQKAYQILNVEQEGVREDIEVTLLLQDFNF